MRMPRLPRPLTRLRRLGLLLLALLPAASCHLADAPPGKTSLAIEADPGLLQRDSILVILKASTGADTLFKGKLKSLDTLSRLPADGYDGGRALIVIQGFDGGLLVYEERRDYNGSTQKNLDVDVPLDQTGSAHASSLDIRPDKVRLFVGGGSQQMQAAPPEAWKDKPLAWSTGDPAIATVSQAGEVSPVGPGVTYVRAVSGDTARDASVVTVVRDVPVIDAGAADTTVQIGASAVFPVKVTQEYGDVAMFSWDLDGDGAFEDSLAGTPGQTQFAAPARSYSAAGEFAIRFRARDVEGNVGTAGKKVKVTKSAPRIDSASAAPATVTIKDLVSFTAQAIGSGAALRSFDWDFDGDGKSDQSGDLAGDKSKVQGEFRFPAENTYKATLRVTDAEGASVTASIPVKVKLDRPVADAGPDLSVSPGATVRLQGRATDTLGRIVSREWKIGDGNFAPASDSGTVSFTAPATPGEVVCVFRVTDDDSLMAEDNLKITVNDSRAPVVKSLLPADTLISIKDLVSFRAKVEAADADLKSYAFDVDGDGKPELEGALAGKAQDLKLERAFANPGKYDVSLKVEDQSGKTATGQARVTVLLDPPSADAGKDTSVAAGARVNLHGRASDSLGKIQQLEWKIGSGPFTLVSKGDTAITAPSSSANLECLFRATDDDGLSDTDTVIVAVGPSGNADLSALALSAGTLSPGFAAATSAYTASVPNATASLTVTPTAATAGTVIKVNGTAVATGTASGAIALAVGKTAITIDVTAQDGTTKKAYTVNVTRAASANADLSALTVSAGTLSPAFAVGVTAYKDTVPNATASLTVTPTTGTAGATIKVNSVAVASGIASAAIPLVVGPNVITIDVTAPDSATKNTYTVTVTRVPGSNADLSALAVSAGALSPAFAAAKVAYQDTVPNATASITLTPTLAAAGGTVKVAGVVVASGAASGAIALAIGTNAIAIDVTAQDGTTKKTYTVTVVRLAGSDATLSGLAVSGATLSPVFAAATVSYTASVANTVASVKVTPTANAAGSTIAVNGVAVVSGTASGAISLAVGPNAISVVVTAQDGTTKKTYTVTVTRAGSANADLSLLAVGAGMTLGTFNSATLTYQVTALYNAPSCRLIPTTADAGATVKVDGSTVVSGTQSPALAFPYGMAKHTVVVLAADGVTTKTYTVMIWRDGPPDVTTGYAWVDVTKGSRTLACCSDWVYNPAGTIIFTKSATGKYRVVFSGLATLGNSEGIVHVTAMSNTAAYCKISDWSSTGDLSAGVACYNAAGTAVDANFNVVALFPRGKLYGGNAYLWSDQSTVAGLSIPYAGRSWNAQTGIDGNLVERTAAGTYTVTFKGFGGSADLGNMMVTATGSTNSRCMVGSWGGNTNDLIATIYCKTPSGTLTDAQFNLSMVQEYTSSAFGMATAWVSGPSTDTRGPYSFSNGGKAISVDTTGVGTYSLTVGGVIDQTSRGNRTSTVQVTAYGAANVTCQLDTGGWINFSDLLTNVYCYDGAGSLVNANFNIWVIE